MGTENRWFLITHEKCGSVFTVNSKILMNKFDDQVEIKAIRCPNCYQDIECTKRLRDFFETYGKLIEKLKDNNYAIREIKKNIDSKQLEL